MNGGDETSVKRNEVTVKKYPKTGTNTSGQQHDQKSISFLSSYGTELSIVFFAIATSNYSIAVQNFYIERICHVDKHLSWEECRNLTSYKNDEKSVEVIASKYVIYQNLIEYGFPILLSFFLGSWTDKNGSKPVFIISLLGYFLTSVFYTIFSLLPNIDPHYILISSLPLAICGGHPGLLISVVSLITRECPIHERSLRLGILSVCFDGGTTLGYFMGEKVYGFMGYTEVFIISSILRGVALLCAVLLVQERKRENLMKKSGSRSFLVELFDLESVKDAIATCFKRRENRRRFYILILTTSIILFCFSYSSNSYTYMFTRNRFGWGLKEYSNFSIATSLFYNIGGLIMTLVAIKLLHIPDIYLGIISSLSNLAGRLAVIFATSGWYMYLGSALQMLGAITSAIMRSILSKCVEPEEHGKLFSFITCLELSMPFVAGPLYGIIYMNTVMSLPSAVFILPVGINVIIALIYVYLHFTMEKVIAHSPLRTSLRENELELREQTK